MEDINSSSVPNTVTSKAEPSPTPENVSTPVVKTQTAEKHVLAALAYFPIAFIVTAIKKGQEEYYMWHAKNGLGTTLLCLLIWIVLWIMNYFFYFGTFTAVIWLAYTVLIVFSAYKAWNGDKWSIPVLTDKAQTLPLEKWFGDTSASTPIAAPIETKSMEGEVNPEQEISPNPSSEEATELIQAKPTERNIELNNEPAVEVEPVTPEDSEVPAEVNSVQMNTSPSEIPTNDSSEQISEPNNAPSTETSPTIPPVGSEPALSINPAPSEGSPTTPAESDTSNTELSSSEVQTATPQMPTPDNQQNPN